MPFDCSNTPVLSVVVVAVVVVVNIERNMLALPPKLGGLGIINPSLCQEFTNSQMITASLLRLILQQDTDFHENVQKEQNPLLSVVRQQLQNK